MLTPEAKHDLRVMTVYNYLVFYISQITRQRPLRCYVLLMVAVLKSIGRLFFCVFQLSWPTEKAVEC